MANDPTAQPIHMIMKHNPIPQPQQPPPPAVLVIFSRLECLLEDRVGCGVAYLTQAVPVGAWRGEGSGVGVDLGRDQRHRAVRRGRRAEPTPAADHRRHDDHPLPRAGRGAPRDPGGDGKALLQCFLGSLQFHGVFH